MLVLGLIIILGLGLHLFNFWAKMQLHELMHNMGSVDTTYAADGVYHIINTFSNPVYVVLYLIWLAALWFHLLTDSEFYAVTGLEQQSMDQSLECISNIYSTIVVICLLPC